MKKLVKGYMRIGEMIGDGEVIDEELGKKDVLIIIKIERI